MPDRCPRCGRYLDSVGICDHCRPGLRARCRPCPQGYHEEPRELRGELLLPGLQEALDSIMASRD